jgi:hypothetical protein
LVLEKLDPPVTEPASDSWQVIGCATVSEDGIKNTTVRFEPAPDTTPAVTVTGDPLPEGGVIVTLTLAGLMVPAGKPVPLSDIGLPGWAADGFTVVRLTCA